MTQSKASPNSYSSVAGVYKSSAPEVKDRASFKAKTPILGELQTLILRALFEAGLKHFTPSEARLYLKNMGFTVDRRRVHDALKRLSMRGLIVRLRRGYYKLSNNAPKTLGKASILKRPAYLRLENKDPQGVLGRSRTAQDTREPRGSVSTGLFLDNVRGVSGGGYVKGDRRRVLSFGDLVFFDTVSYSELQVRTGTSFLRGLGVIVLYHSCVDVYGRLECSDVVEWRPPRGFIRLYGLLEAKRFLLNNVIWRGLAVYLKALKTLFSPGEIVKALKSMLRFRSPYALETLRELCRAYDGSPSYARF